MSYPRDCTALGAEQGVVRAWGVWAKVGRGRQGGVWWQFEGFPTKSLPSAHTFYLGGRTACASRIACFHSFPHMSVEELPVRRLPHALSCLPQELSGPGLPLQVLLSWSSGGRTAADMQPSTQRSGILCPKPQPYLVGPLHPLQKRSLLLSPLGTLGFGPDFPTGGAPVWVGT